MKCFLHIWRPRASTLLLNSRLLAHLSEFLLTDICNLGDAQRGATLFKARCQQCHSIGKFEGNKGGPNLYGVVGRKTGEAVNYKYSEATKQKNITWSEDTLVCVLVFIFSVVLPTDRSISSITLKILQDVYLAPEWSSTA